MPHLHAPKRCSWTQAGRSNQVCVDHAGTMQGPHRDHRGLGSLPFSHPLLESRLLPGDTGHQSVPDSTTLAQAPHGTGTGGTAQSTGALSHFPPSPLCCTGITAPQDPRASPKTKPHSPYSRSCR